MKTILRKVKTCIFLQEVGPDKDHMYNCHVIISSQGEIEAAYRKVHLFDVDVPNGPVLMESRSTSPGKEVKETCLCAKHSVEYLLHLGPYH